MYTDYLIGITIRIHSPITTEQQQIDLKPKGTMAVLIKILNPMVAIPAAVQGLRFRVSSLGDYLRVGLNSYLLLHLHPFVRPIMSPPSGV